MANYELYEKVSELRYDTTTEAFETFKKYAEAYIKFFGLSDWRVTFQHGPVDEGGLAECFTSQQQHSCLLVLSTCWSMEPTDEAIKKVVFHEIWELLTSELETVGRPDYDLSERARGLVLERARHTLISRMENCVYPYLPLDI